MSPHLVLCPPLLASLLSAEISLGVTIALATDYISVTLRRNGLRGGEMADSIALLLFQLLTALYSFHHFGPVSFLKLKVLQDCSKGWRARQVLQITRDSVIQKHLLPSHSCLNIFFRNYRAEEREKEGRSMKKRKGILPESIRLVPK